MLKTKIAKVVSAVGILGLVFVTSASADTDIRVSGNGYGSDNRVRVDTNKNVAIRQSNDTTIRNDVSISNITGHNSANGNTGGDVAIKTGDADANVSIHNKAGLNVARVSGCNGCNEDLDINIHGNGAFSDNNVRLSSDKTTRVDQNNNTNIDTQVDVENNTGNNRASGNTGYWKRGDGDVRIETGDAEANVSIKNEAGLNVAQISGCNECDEDLDIKIHGNGAFSDNKVKFSKDSQEKAHQDNDTDINNDVNVNNHTGYTAGDSDRYKHDYGKHDYEKDRYHESDKKGEEEKSDYGKDHDYNKHDNNSYSKDSYHFVGNKKDHDYSYKFINYDDHEKKVVKDHDYDKKQSKKDHDNNNYVDQKKSYDHDKDKKDAYHKDHYNPYVKHDDYDYDKKYREDDGAYAKKYTNFSYPKLVDSKHDYEHKGKLAKNYGDHKSPIVLVLYPKHKDSDYKKDDDHDKKYSKHDDKKYSYVKQVSYNSHSDKKHVDVKKHYKLYTKHLDYEKYFKKQDLDKYVKKDNHKFAKNPYWYSKYYGNKGGDVLIRTGDAKSKVSLVNYASANYISL